MSARRRRRRIVRTVLDVIAVLVIAYAIGSIEALPAWLPFLLILCALALVYFARRVTVISRRAEQRAFARGRL